MQERHIEIQELRRNLSKCLDEVRRGTTLRLTDGEQPVARLVPEPESSKSKGNLPIEQGRGRLKVAKPRARLRGGGSMADIVRENRR